MSGRDEGISEQADHNESGISRHEVSAAALTTDDPKTQRREVPPFPDRDFIDREFTPERIEAEGRRLLFRALNTRQVVGFIGSGVASAFGRPTWSRLIDETYARVGKLTGDDNDERRASVARALDDVAEARRDRNSDPDVLLLFAQLVRSLAKDAKPESPYEHDDAVQAEVKAMTRDDDEIAKAAWAELKKKDEEPEAAWWRWLDSREGLNTVLKFLKSKANADARLLAHLGRIGEALDHQISPNSRNVSRKAPAENRRLCEDLRLLAPLLIAIAEGLGVLDDLRKYLRPRENPNGPAKDARETLTTADAERSSSFDPVQLIFDGLHIRRLITTNYDFELERGLERLGFQRNRLRPPLADATAGQAGEPLADALEAERPIGNKAYATVFNVNTAADLVSFAARAERRDYEVFHLHGRAAQGREERLIITEPDYQTIYMRDSPEAHIMKEALTAVLAGNPVMFIGMGMQEADFLRPLRQFVAGPGPRINRAIIALLPAEESKAHRTRIALQLYLRYGVHTIFYGFASFVPVRSEHEDAPLYLALKRIGALKKVANREQTFASNTENTDACRLAVNAFAKVPQAKENGVLLASLDAAEELLKRIQKKPPSPLRNKVKTKSSGTAKPPSPLYRYLSELDGRIRTRALCAALIGLEGARSQWWKEWVELPKPRTFAHTVEAFNEGKWDRMTANQDEPYLKAGGPVIRNIRYRVADFQKDSRSPLNKPKEFRAVLSRIQVALPVGSNSRRVFIVHGDAGSGRGSLFHYLADEFVTGPDDRARYNWGLFTNANFSTEYSSVIDGVNHFLLRCLKSRAEQEKPTVRSPLSRREAVLEYLKAIYDPDRTGQSTSGRGLFVIGGAELLFRGGGGTAKNSEIVGALSAFLDEMIEKYPIDVVLICRTDKCRDIFGKNFDRPVGLYPKIPTDADRLTFGHMVRVTADKPRKVSNPEESAPRFHATILKLETPRLDERIKETLNNSNLSDSYHVFEKSLTPSLERAMLGRFNASIILQCAVHACQQFGEGGLESFLRSLGDAVSKSNPGRDSDIVLAAVLSNYAHQCRENPDQIPDVATDPDKVEVAEKKLCEELGAIKSGLPRIDPDLFQLILKHVAMMSGPVEVGVLALCPEISRKCESMALTPPEAIPFAKENRRMNGRKSHRRFHVAVAIVQNHLNWLVSRRLLFRLRERDEFRLSNRKTQDVPDSIRGTNQFLRYAAHQSLHSYFFHLIGASFLELGDSRLFTVSLLAAPGKHLPAPSRSAIEFVMELIRELICYPRSSMRLHDNRREWLREREVCALRAAVSLTRSAFSFSVISRFSQFDHTSFRTPRRFGVLEEYRNLLRWMIFQAGMLGDEPTAKFKTDTQGKDAAEKQRVLRFRFNALYQDEITWLYNECGLVSLVQGNLFDAVALLDSAADSNRLIETGSETGPNALRIRINQAVVQIERGNLSRANTELQTIARASPHEPTVFGIADGYRGLVAHLRGRLTQAEEHYADSISVLRAQGEARAISVFRKHSADLKRKHHDAKGCREELLSALAEAESSRQHDQIYRVHVSLALCDLAEQDLTADMISRVVRRLDETIRYADTMEIHSLKAEALLARAQVTHLQGETRSAGDEVVSALAISTLHGQRLRAIVALGRLGEVIAERPGHEAQGERLLKSASRMADLLEYQLAKTNIGERLISSAI